MELFEFSPEVVRLIGTILQALGVIIVVVASINGYAKWKGAVRERDEAQKQLETALDDNYQATKDYARVTDNNSALIKQINELKVRVSTISPVSAESLRLKNQLR